MMIDRRFFRTGYSGIFALVTAFLLVGNCISAAEQANDSAGPKYKIFDPLKHISVEQGEAYLAQLVTGTVTHFPGSRALLVTAQPSELAKARIILDLVDSPDQFVIKKILPLSAARKMPSNAQIAAKLSPALTRGLSIGNFSDPPSANASAKAIIDIHNDAVIAIAPAALLERIVAAVGPLPSLSSVEEPQRPRTPDKARASSSQKAPELNNSAEARFLLAANGPSEQEPNAATATAPQEASPRPAAPANEPPALPDGEQVVNLALADRQKLTIVELLGLVGPYLQLDFMYDEKDVAQEVTLNPNGKFRGPIKVNDLYSLLEEVLKFKSLAMTRSKGNLVTIVPVGNALDIDPTLLEAHKDGIKRGDGIVQKIFTLKNIDINSAQNLLTGMRLTTSITPIPETKTLIVTGYAHRMPRIQTLLDLVDKPGEPKKFRFRPLRYTMSQTLAPKLQMLAEQLGTISITVAETAETAAAATPSPRRPGETDAQYQARLRAEEAARARQLASLRAATALQQPAAGLPSVYLDADDRTNRILMIGLDKQLDDVEELVDTLDVAQQDLRTLELYKIKNIDAVEARKKLEELGVVSPSTMMDSTRFTEGARAAATTMAATGATTPAVQKPPLTRSSMTRGFRGEESESLLEEPQVVVIEATNSLLANATAEQHARISRILNYVDRETDKEEIPYKLYPLENQSPEHLTEVLSKLIQETVKDKEGKIQQVIPKQDEQITIVPDPNTFSLVVYATKKNQEWISTLVKQLDQRRPQVLIDVTLVQISKTDAFNYDLNLISSFPDLTSTSGLTSAVMPGTQGTNLVSTLAGSGRDRFIDLQSNGGNGTGFYGDRHINALLTMMQQKDYGRVLAKPKILVNDNQKGTISTTDTTYVTKKSSIPLQSGAAGQPATVVETQISYEPYPAGITLEITPHISRGDFLRLDINLKRSDFGTITGEKPPDTTESNVATTVTVPDQSTIILGGLLKLNQSKGGTKIPLLGDIPFIGGLFRTASNSDIQRNLYVFVKAEIIRPEEQGVVHDGMQRISERNRNAFEEHETEFQEYYDWPGIKPQTMTPGKVLDAQ
jgi:type II secretory pathway component GspD/PulD (secretin)